MLETHESHVCAFLPHVSNALLHKEAEPAEPDGNITASCSDLVQYIMADHVAVYDATGQQGVVAADRAEPA